MRVSWTPKLSSQETDCPKCSLFSVTSNSRMMYAFSRDGALPGHKFFHKVDQKRKSPIRTGKFVTT